MSVKRHSNIVDAKTFDTPLARVQSRSINYVLLVGEGLGTAHKKFKKHNSSLVSAHVLSVQQAYRVIVTAQESRPYNTVVVDTRDADHINVEAVEELGAILNQTSLLVLAKPQEVELYQALSCVDKVKISFDDLQENDTVEHEIDDLEKRFEEELVSDELEVGAETPAPLDGQTKSGADVVVKPQLMKAEQGKVEKRDGLSVKESIHFAELAFEGMSSSKLDFNQPLESALGDDVHSVEQGRDETAATEKLLLNEQDTPSLVPNVEEINIEPQEQEDEENQKQTKVQDEKSLVTKGFESSLSKIQDVDRGIWQRFVPLVNFLYKKLAIVLLSALLLTFLTYGIMIVFFMTTSSWSLPFSLSKGHALVSRIERDLATMLVKKNQLNQDITATKTLVLQAIRDQKDGTLQIGLTQKTIEEELSFQRLAKQTAVKDLERFETVLNDFNTLNTSAKTSDSLKQAYKKRLITRKALDNATLSLLDALHKIAKVEAEIDNKKVEIIKLESRITFLQELLQEVDQDEIRLVSASGSELVYLARDLIESKNRINKAKQAQLTAEKQKAGQENSLQLISKSIAILSATPAAKAIDKAVTVLFVPYDNAANVREGEPLYACKLALFFCSHVGEVGKAIDGETSSTHPLFSKPMRGTFMEAQFNNPDSMTEELLHVGRPPLFF